MARLSSADVVRSKLQAERIERGNRSVGSPLRGQVLSITEAGTLPRFRRRSAPERLSLVDSPVPEVLCSGAAPRPSTLDLDFERDAQEGPDQDDQTEHGHAFDGRPDDHGRNDVGGYEEF